MKRDKEQIRKKIEEARKELHEALKEGLDGREVYKCSERVDVLIARYLDAQGRT